MSNSPVSAKQYADVTKSLTSYLESIDDAPRYIYSEINRSDSPCGRIIGIEDIRNAWNGSCRGSLVKLLVMDHYRGRIVDTGRSSIYVTSSTVTGLAQAIRNIVFGKRADGGVARVWNSTAPSYYGRRRRSRK